MVRNPLKREADLPAKETPQAQQPQAPQTARGGEPQVQIVEREINLALLNDKLNYITGILLKVADACEVDLD